MRVGLRRLLLACAACLLAACSGLPVVTDKAASTTWVAAQEAPLPSLVRRLDEWPYSSLAAHRSGVADGLVDPLPLDRRIPDWDRFLSTELAWNEAQRVRSHSSSGLPLGHDRFVDELERLTGRVLRPPAERLHAA